MEGRFWRWEANPPSPADLVRAPAGPGPSTNAAFTALFLLCPSQCGTALGAPCCFQHSVTFHKEFFFKAIKKGLSLNHQELRICLNHGKFSKIFFFPLSRRLCITGLCCCSVHRDESAGCFSLQEDTVILVCLRKLKLHFNRAAEPPSTCKLIFKGETV